MIIQKIKFHKTISDYHTPIRSHWAPIWVGDASRVARREKEQYFEWAPIAEAGDFKYNKGDKIVISRCFNCSCLASRSGRGVWRDVTHWRRRDASTEPDVGYRPIEVNTLPSSTPEALARPRRFLRLFVRPAEILRNSTPPGSVSTCHKAVLKRRYLNMYAKCRALGMVGTGNIKFIPQNNKPIAQIQGKVES